jgi:tetratricopeptide (TPR) repeat protein
MGLAQVYLSTGRYDEAFEMADYVLSENPQNGRALQTAGLAQLMIKNYASATGYLIKYLMLFPGDIAVRNHLAVAYLQSGQLNEGAAEYERILEYDPENGEIRLNLGVLCLGLNRFDDALAHLDLLLEQYPENKKGKLYRGIALANLDQKDKAKKVFEDLLNDAGEWAAHAKKQLDLLNNLN